MGESIRGAVRGLWAGRLSDKGERLRRRAGPARGAGTPGIVQGGEVWGKRGGERRGLRTESGGMRRGKPGLPVGASGGGVC